MREGKMTAAAKAFMRVRRNPRVTDDDLVNIFLVEQAMKGALDETLDENDCIKALVTLGVPEESAAQHLEEIASWQGILI
jgi:hypothetical protein